MGICSCKPVGNDLLGSLNVTSLFDSKAEPRVPERLKMILLGAGNAGKTTILKQFRLYYGNGFTDEERLVAKQVLRRSYVTAMQKLLYAVSDILTSDQLGMRKGAVRDYTPANKPLVQYIKDLGDSITVMDNVSLSSSKATNHTRNASHASPASASSISAAVVEGGAIHHHNRSSKRSSTIVKDLVVRLWGDPLIQKAYHYNSLITTLEEPMDYLMEHIERITTAGYIPNDEDMLYVREATEKADYFDFDFAVKEEKSNKSKILCRVVDLGGQRYFRPNWVPELNGNVFAVFFVVGLDGFDQVLVEDGKTNRMTESLEIFRDICQAPALAKANFMLILNKLDLFKIKWQRIQRAYNAQRKLEKAQEVPAEGGDDVAGSRTRSKSGRLNAKPQGKALPEHIKTFFTSNSKITGKDSHLTACDYIVKKFVAVHAQEMVKNAKNRKSVASLNELEKPRVYPFVTCATDIDTMNKFVVNSMKTTVTLKNLSFNFF